ncbi:gonadal protein gdl [Chrysoperla carnea]|uniref:gonadal protein gdl n=1 Tax=Chrysoperla carnea TaxID=189513 RepID=UPI001D07D122|nr:gonadal protein gdl [Chrysoperla carnea]
MDNVPEEYYPGDSPETLQRKLYCLLEQLQSFHQKLEPEYQMRIPYELLSGLANSLLNETIFEIVKGLMEIQHVTEKQLFHQRLQLIRKHEEEFTETLNHQVNNNLLTVEEKIKNVCLLKLKQKDELKLLDLNIIRELDKKVRDQQEILEKAGVPGFYATIKETDLKVQMHLLDFILRLSTMKLDIH